MVVVYIEDSWSLTLLLSILFLKEVNENVLKVHGTESVWVRRTVPRRLVFT